MSFDDFLNDSVDIKRRTDTQDSMGSWTEAWSTGYSSVPCRIRALNGVERAMRSSMGVDVSHRLYCRASYTLSEKDVVVKGSTTYAITFADDWNQQGEYLILDLREIRAG